ncbi:hypothetical protein [Neisseria sicca]
MIFRFIHYKRSSEILKDRVSDDLSTPSRSVGFAHEKKTILFIARLRNQAIDFVGKAHATIRGRYCRALPVAR